MEELGLFSIWSIAEKLNVSKMSGFKLSEDICGKVSQRVEDHEPNDSFLHVLLGPSRKLVLQ